MTPLVAPQAQLAATEPGVPPQQLEELTAASGARLRPLTTASLCGPLFTRWRMFSGRPSVFRPSFRCSCVRDGQHAFGSLDVAAAVGGGVHRSFGWSVDLTGFDVEVLEPPYPCYSPPNLPTVASPLLHPCRLRSSCSRASSSWASRSPPAASSATIASPLRPAPSCRTATSGHGCAARRRGPWCAVSLHLTASHCISLHRRLSPCVSLHLTRLDLHACPSPDLHAPRSPAPFSLRLPSISAGLAGPAAAW